MRIKLVTQVFKQRRRPTNSCWCINVCNIGFGTLNATGLLLLLQHNVDKRQRCITFFSL